jgi:hypothetical protein
VSLKPQHPEGAIRGRPPGRGSFVALRARGARTWRWIRGLALDSAVWIGYALAAATIYGLAPLLLIFQGHGEPPGACVGHDLRYMPELTPCAVAPGAPLSTYGAAPRLALAWFHGLTQRREFLAEPGSLLSLGAQLTSVLALALAASIPLALVLWYCLERLRPPDLPLMWRRAADVSVRRLIAGLLRNTARMAPVAATLFVLRLLAEGYADRVGFPWLGSMADAAWISGTALALAILPTVRAEFLRLRAAFQPPGAICACGYWLGGCGSCPECGTPRSEGASYYRVRQRRVLAALAVSLAAAVAALGAASCWRAREEGGRWLASGILSSALERAHADPSAVYVRVPCNAVISIGVGDQEWEVRVRLRYSLLGPMVHLQPDRHFATRAIGELRLDVSPSPGRSGTPPSSQPSSGGTTRFDFTRYGPVNIVPRVDVGTLHITAGTDLDMLGCVELLISDTNGREPHVVARVPHPDL